MDLKNPQPGTTGDRLSKCEEAPEAAYLDNDLVRRTRQGDVGAFEELFKRHQTRIYNIALRMLSDEAGAADATQEVFVRAYQSLANLKSDAAFVTWLKTMAINHCRDVLRKRGRTRVDSLDAPLNCDDGGSLRTEIPDWSANPERALDKKFMREAVQRAIGSLQPDYREAVMLFYVDGSDVAEIARVLGCPVGTIKSRLSRARAELKRKLAGHVNFEL